MSLEVVRAGEGDGPALAALRYRWRSEEGGESGRTLSEYAATLGEWIDAHRASHVAYLARLDGEPVGEAWRATVDRVPGLSRPRRAAAFLQAVYVAPERRGAGVGTALVGRLVADARDEGYDYLVVHPTERSFPFYRRLGFADADRALELRFS